MNINKGKLNRLKYHKLLALVLIALVVIMDVGMILLPDRAASETENRNLMQRPALSAHGLLSGAFEADFEDYIADQFPLRDQWILLESTVSRMLGKTESGDIYLGRKGYMIQKFRKPDGAAYNQTLDAIQAITSINSQINCMALVAPTAVSVMDNKLPLFADTDNQDSYLDSLKRDFSNLGIQWIDVREALKAHRDDTQLYYKTDHHWTTDAAYIAYQVMADEARLKQTVTYTPEMVSDSFKGTLTASSGMRVSETDEMYVYQPNEPIDYTVTYIAENERSASYLKSSCLETRDQYAMFFNGNHPQVKIETTSGNARTLLIFKDSYANCFVPFLIPNYAKIIMVDPRYYTDDIRSLIETEAVSDILFLYNASTLSQDTVLAQMMDE